MDYTFLAILIIISCRGGADNEVDALPELYCTEVSYPVPLLSGLDIGESPGLLLSYFSYAGRDHGNVRGEFAFIQGVHP